MSARLRASLICSTSEPTLEGLLARCTALAITRMRPDDASLLNGWVHQAAAEFDLILVACPVVEVSRPLWDKLVHSRVPVIALCREQAVGQLAVETGATEYLEWDLLTPHALERFAALIVAARSKRSENDPSSLQENTLALSTAVEQSPVSIVITDSDGCIEYVNPKFTRLTGYNLSEVAGHNPRVLKSGHTTPAEYAALWASIKSGREWRGEFLNRKKSGELYWEEALISPVRDNANRITHFVAVKEDITARKYSEAQVVRLNEQLEANVRERTAQLQTMHQRIAAVMESTSDAIVMIDQNDRIEISNPAFARTFQYSAEEIRGASLHVLVESDQHAVFTRALQLTRASGQGGQAEVRACRKDGTIFDASCAFGNVVENGYIVCSMRDITPLKESERLKDRFVSMVNHELRTPLTAIMLSADTLLTYSDRMDEEKRHGKLLQIRDQARIMTELIESVLDLRRLADQRTEQAFASIDVCALAQQAVADMQSAYTDKHQEVTVDCLPDEDCFVPLSASDMKQILRNLIGNAIKYTPENGKIVVRAGTISVPVVPVTAPVLTGHALPGHALPDHVLPGDSLPGIVDMESAAAALPESLEPGDYFVAQVEDDGPGIPPDNIDHLFDRFYRGWAETSHIPGTGLGLALVKEILDHCGGGIVVDSEIGQGSRFTFYIPEGKTA